VDAADDVRFVDGRGETVHVAPGFEHFTAEARRD
jgi:hypothetical protein